MKTSLNITQTAKTAGLVLAGLLLGWLLFGGSSGHKTTGLDEHIEEAHTDEQGNIVYTCSMHPQVRRNEPGNCPICGMELIPLDDAGQQDETTFTMTEAAVKLADIQTTRVERRVPELETRLPGRVAADERRVASITAPFGGRIEELFVDFTGIHVEKGEQLASIYSPELLSAQRELIEAAKNRETDSRLYESARKKLELWELPESEIRRIETTGRVTDRLPVSATRSGYVIQKNVNAKDYVNQGTVMYKVADLSRLWVLFDAYETDLGTVKTGDSVEFSVRSYPGRTFKATVTYIDPVVNPQTRTARVRAEVANPEGALKPGMLARGIITGSDGREPRLMIPRSAVLWTGKRSIVFVKYPGADVPTFEARLVTLGPRAGDYYVVEEGLEADEQVVTHGNFKLDSAAQLADKLSMMNREPGTGANRAGHDHGTMEEMPAVERSVTTEQDVPAAFRQQLKEAVTAYLQIKDALVASDAGLAGEHAGRFLERLAKVDMMLLEGSAHDRWMEFLDPLQQAGRKINGKQTLKAQREAFGALSGVLAGAVKSFGVEGVIYRQYCPMAFDNQGGYWLSADEEIRNPYFGEAMLNCGEVVEAIKN